MRKHILLLIALCLQIAAQGQATLDDLDLSGLPQPTQAAALRYWFDDDDTSAQTLTTSGVHTLDVSSLIEGLHTLHCQVMGTDGQVSYVASSLFLKTGTGMGGDSPVASQLRYWFDDDDASAQTLTTAGIHTLDVSSLLEGLHTLHCQVMGTDGQVSYVASSLFLKTAARTGSTQALSLRYWFDDDDSHAKTANVTDGVYAIDVTALTDGLHTLHCQVVDADGVLYYIASGEFTKIGVNTDTRIELVAGWNWISQNQQEPLSVETVEPHAQRIVSQTSERINDPRFGWTGMLTELQPTQLYKVQMSEDSEVQLSGELFSATLRSLTLRRGWNWTGYPLNHALTPADALSLLEAEEGDLVMGLDGMVVYNDGQWTGTLAEMVPGQGYMFRSQSDKELFYNVMAINSRRAKAERTELPAQHPDGWSADKHKYPDVMGIIAQLSVDGRLASAGEWLLGAFSGEECRGVAQAVGDELFMMNVYGRSGDPISFRAMNVLTGEVMDVQETEPFRSDVLGALTPGQPLQLHAGETTGMRTVTTAPDTNVYDMQGRKVDAARTKKGVYIVTGGNKQKAQKMVRR